MKAHYKSLFTCFGIGSPTQRREDEGRSCAQGEAGFVVGGHEGAVNALNGSHVAQQCGG
jgi:hypothetical protein